MKREHKEARSTRKVFLFLVALAIWLAPFSYLVPDVSGAGGYLLGDAAPNKLVPFYRVGPSLATIIGLENVEETEGPEDPFGEDLAVLVTIFSKRSARVLDLGLCLSPFDFGFIVLQQDGPNATQQAELAQRGAKAIVVSVATDGIPSEGYVLLESVAEFESTNGKCKGDVDSVDNHEGLATWAILADIGNGFFTTEVPTPTVNVNPFTRDAAGGPFAFGLIPGPPLAATGNPFDEFPLVGTSPSSTVIARFDVNPAVSSHTEIYVWLQRNAFVVPNDPGSGINRFGASHLAFLDCEDELQISTTIFLPDEVNIIDPDTLAGIGQCKAAGQYRGVLRFKMPDTGFLWSNISQEGEHFRQTYLGYNLGDNDFIDCADGHNDFSGDPQASGPPLC